MPDPYRNTSVIDQRDAITKALMGIATPPPRSVPPQMPPYRPPMGLPQMPPQGAPPMGAPPPQGLPQTMPLSPGVPPMRPGMAGTGMTPGMAGAGSAGPMPLNPNLMQRPGGL
jgi:hypothetical protein